MTSADHALVALRRIREARDKLAAKSAKIKKGIWVDPLYKNEVILARKVYDHAVSVFTAAATRYFEELEQQKKDNANGSGDSVRGGGDAEAGDAASQELRLDGQT